MLLLKALMKDFHVRQAEKSAVQALAISAVVAAISTSSIHQSGTAAPGQPNKQAILLVHHRLPNSLP